jgi:hypothetical protein
MTAFDKGMRCEEIAPLLVFYVCDEVSEQERKQVEAHLATCAACAKQLAEEQMLCDAMSDAFRPGDAADSAGILLAQCRSELAETLDDLSAPPLQEHWRPFGWLRRWMALRPAWSGALLVLFGLLLGTQVWPLLQANNAANGNNHVVNVTAKPRLSEDQLSNMVVAGVNYSPGGGDAAQGTVQVQMSAEQPIEFSGNLDDADIRRVLTYVVVNGERFDSGVRLDCLDALRARVRDLEVRQALLTAARKDQNPAVRMKALESLRDSAADDAVRQTLLEVLAQDTNPGVRVEAVNLLVRSLQRDNSDATVVGNVLEPTIAPDVISVPNDPSVERVVRALEELQRRDPSRYVRLRSAAALRQIGPRELQ